MNICVRKNWNNIAIISLLLVMILVIPVSAADAPTVNGAATNPTGTIITITFNKTMADPSGKHDEFKYKINGGADQSFSAAALNGVDKFDLTTSGTAIAYGDTVTVSYTLGTVLAEDDGILATFTGHAVTNNKAAGTAPTVSAAVTNTAGNVITITFNKPMASPVGKQAEFKYKINGGADQSFSAAALNGVDKFDLTTSGTAIAYGDTVTVSYTLGTVLAEDGGVLATFTGHAVTNNVPAPGAPVAAFTNTTPRSGTAPLTVSFTDQSTGSITSHAWDFNNDGTNESTLANPLPYTYTTAGDYTVKLTVTGPGGSNSSIKTGYITVGEPAPVAGFSGTPTSGPKPLNVQFSDESTGVIDTYAWDFGDGHASNAQNPSHNYPAIGSYSVNLTVTGPGGSDFEIKTNYITVGDSPPVAGFSGTPTSGPKPLNVQFTDASTGNVTSYLWNFGEGNTSILKNPSHIYSAVGSYTVNLTVTGPGGSDPESKTDYIMVTNATTNIGIYKNGVWNLVKTGGLTDQTFTYGLPGDTALVGDWDGDGKDTIGIYRNNEFYLRNSNTVGNADLSFLYGIPGDTALVGDWDGDGVDTVGIYRNNEFYLRNSNTVGNADVSIIYGVPGDTALVGDWDGNGADTIGIYRNNEFYLRNSNTVGNADLSFLYGIPGDTALVGDWDGNGVDSVGIIRDSVWYLDYNGDGVFSSSANTIYTFLGVAGWTPVVGDWSGNGITKIGVYKDSVWNLDFNGNGILDTGETYNLVPLSFTTPVVGDWNGNGKSKVGYYKQGSWSLDYYGGGSYSKFSTFMQLDDTLRIPVVGDWNGDGKTEIGVYRNSNGAVNLDLNGNGVWDESSDRAINFDVAYWTPVIGDWNGDGKSKMGVYKDGTWLLDYDGNYVWNATVDKSYNFGVAGSIPVIGDWNGNGKSKIGVFKDGAWLLDYNGNGALDSGTDQEYSFGATGDTPVVGKWT